MKRFEVVRHTRYGGMHRAAQIGRAFAVRCYTDGWQSGGIHRDQTPQPVRKPPGAGNTGFAPVEVAFRRAVGQHEPARGIGAIGADDVFRVDDVLFRFRHLLGTTDGHRHARLSMDQGVALSFDHVGRLDPGAGFVLVGFVADHALGEQAREWLIHAGMTCFLHRPGEKPRIKQVQDRVFDPADILIDRQPVIRRGAVGRRVGMGCGEACEIP